MLTEWLWWDIICFVLIAVIPMKELFFGRGFNSRHLHQIYGGVLDSTGCMNRVGSTIGEGRNPSKLK